MLVQRARNQFFTGAGLARDQNRHVGLGQAADSPKHFLHGRSLPQNFRSLQGKLLDIDFSEAFFERAPYQLYRLVQIKRLGQIIERPALERCDCRIQIRKRGHHDDRQAGMNFFDFLQQGQSRHAVHADIGHQYLRSALLKGGQNIFGITETARFQILTRERFFKHPAY